MAKLLLINAKTKRDVNNLGDVVGVFNDDHPFTAAEYAAFDIVDVKGTREEVEAKLHAQLPAEKEVYENKDGNVLDYTPDIKPEEAIRRYRVFDDGGVWKEIVKPAKYRISLNQMSTEDKLALSSETPEVVEATIAKITPAIKLKAENIAVESIKTITTKEEIASRIIEKPL